nr:integrase, catalytic region, zinc finger, CCHC-type, peptidase aspartic, catalytic [Tanacetum cinerariifolium]
MRRIYNDEGGPRIIKTDGRRTFVVGNVNMAFDLRPTEDVLPWPGNANMAFDLRPMEDVLPWPGNANMAFDLRPTGDVLLWPGNANMAFDLVPDLKCLLRWDIECYVKTVLSCFTKGEYPFSDQRMSERDCSHIIDNLPRRLSEVKYIMDEERSDLGETDELVEADFRKNFPNLMGEIFMEIKHMLPRLRIVLKGDGIALLKYYNYKEGTSDGENLDKMKEKGDECIFVGYSNQSRAYRVFNKRTRVIMESIHVNFDELPQMALAHNSSDPSSNQF